MLTLITVASGYAYTYAMAQSRGGEVTYAINVMLQLAEGVDGIVAHRGGSTVLQFEFRQGILVSAEETQYPPLFISIDGAPYYLPPASSPVYKTRRIHYVSSFSMYPSTPILDRGVESKDVYVASANQVEEPNLVFHYSSGGRTYVAYHRQPLVSIVQTAGKTSIHIIFVTFKDVAVKAGPAVFVLEGHDTSSLHMPLASKSPTVNLVLLKGLVQFTANVGANVPNALKQGDILEVYAHQMTIAAR